MLLPSFDFFEVAWRIGGLLTSIFSTLRTAIRRTFGHRHQATDGTPRYVMFYHTNCKSIDEEMVGGYLPKYSHGDSMVAVMICQCCLYASTCVCVGNERNHWQSIYSPGTETVATSHKSATSSSLRVPLESNSVRGKLSEHTVHII